MSSEEKITICIPTKNRSDFLARLLHHFANEKYRYWIFIGDSSDASHIDKTKKIIQSLSGRLNVKHFECPGLSETGATEYMNQFITTPYCALLGDDDLLCVKSIDKCIDFLDSNSDYGAAHGVGILTSVDRNGPYGNISEVYYYPQMTLNADSGSQRLRDYFACGPYGPYALLFSVHRTSIWRDMFRGFISSDSWVRFGFGFGEIIPSSISSVRGKVKELDCLYLVRFSHESRYLEVGSFDWLINQDWKIGFKNLRDRVVNELIRQDGISKEKAEEVFKQAFRPYLARVIRRIPYSLLVKFLGHKVISQVHVRKRINLLPSLLTPTSVHHEDFMPIYQTITTPAGVTLN